MVQTLAMAYDSVRRERSSRNVGDTAVEAHFG